MTSYQKGSAEHDTPACTQGQMLSFVLLAHSKHITHLLGAQCVDDAALAHIWVAHEADGDGLLVRAQACKLRMKVEVKANLSWHREGDMWYLRS